MSSCVFCRIVAGEIPSKKVHEDAHCIGFVDLHPQAPTHVLFIPKTHLRDLNAASLDERLMLGNLMVAASQFAKTQGFAERGYRLVVNCNEEGGQTVFHLHLHLLAGRQMTWPPG
jgi:histidine triad (HIT) family protein